MRPDSEISALGQNWSQKTWDRYLNATCDVRNKAKEVSLYKGKQIETDSSNEHGAKVFEGLNVDCVYPRLKKKLGDAVAQLSNSQKAVMHWTFWEGLTEAQAARRMRVHRSTVLHTQRRGLKNLEKGLLDRKTVESLDLAIQLIKGHEEENLA